MALKSTHIDDKGNAVMVDIASKSPTRRRAVARARVKVSEKVMDAIRSSGVKKGGALSVAQLAGIMGAKKTSELIPLCHPIPIENITCVLWLDEEKQTVEIEITAATTAKTGIEMEALTGAAVAALTVYDMVKSIDKGMVIQDIRLIKKTGGKSGTYVRKKE